MSELNQYKAQPSWFDLPEKVADEIHRIYVTEQKSMDEAVRLAKQRTGLQFNAENGRRFIRANGWKRPPSFYSKRSPWYGLARAAFEESKAKNRVAGDG